MGAMMSLVRGVLRDPTQHRVGGCPWGGGDAVRGPEGRREHTSEGGGRLGAATARCTATALWRGRLGLTSSHLPLPRGSLPPLPPPPCRGEVSLPLGLAEGTNWIRC